MDWFKKLSIKRKQSVQTDLVKGIIVGAGIRGKAYSQYAKQYPERFQIVGVAEPREIARNWIKDAFELPDDRCYEGWQSLSEVDKFADCVLICTQDQDHVGAASAFAKKGYDILLEKPMAVTVEGCKEVYNACRDNNVKLVLGHVLRYHPSVVKLKEMIDSGVIGEVVNISHMEPVGYWHFAHAFVRGNWSNEEKSTFSLLSKCCHDVDLINYWMEKQECVRVSSFGSLFHFKKANKPKDAGDNCLQCKVESDCPYSAKKIYLDSCPPTPVWPMTVVCDIEDNEKGYFEHLKKALEKDSYGRCVYESNNDVCDNQVVNFQFANGSTANLTMIAFTKDIGQRKTTIYGTKGELKWGYLNNQEIQHFDFLTNTSTTIECVDEDDKIEGWNHSGSDYYLIKSFVKYVATKDEKYITTGPEISMQSHLLTFAAEHSRKTGNVVNLKDDDTFKI